ncbi:MAG TPA: glycosyltransferase family 4 protein [Vicinamibacterales bacterium]|nr:glycosyltransferase family 4 protein [Vicinamibacterales bacterium]
MPLRVLHIAPYGPETWAYGGIPRVVDGLTRGLARRGHRVTICTTDAHDAKSRLRPAARGHSRWSPHASTSASGVEQRVFPNVSNLAAYHFQAFAPIGLQAFLGAHAQSFDLAHLHACHNLPGAVAARALAAAGVPWVVSPNGTAPFLERRIVAKRLFDRLAGARVLAGASLVLAVSAAEEAQLQACGIPVSGIRRLPNPVALPVDEPLPRGRYRKLLGIGEAPMVAFVGKITPRKQLGTLVEAFARLPPDARLVLGGNDLGGLREALARAEALGVRHRTHVTGLLQGAARLHLMTDADVVAYVSRDEVFGLVACESLLAGTPVVVGNDSGCAEVIGAAGGGIVAAPGDARALAAAIGRVLASPGEWRRAARGGGERVRSLFSEQTVSTRLESLYFEALGHEPRVPA